MKIILDNTNEVRSPRFHGSPMMFSVIAGKICLCFTNFFT